MDHVQEIKSRLSITQVVEKYIPLKKAGRNMKGLCPFHNDSHPSFLVSEEKEMCWCFVCQSGGDMFNFVQKIENIDFPEALKILADMAGVPLTTFSGKNQGVKKEKKIRLMELLEETQRFFRENFQTNPRIQQTVAQRQLSDHIIEKFGIGYARDDFHALEQHLAQQGFARKEMMEAGIVSSKDDRAQEVYDRFRKRIIFPIHDLHGSIRGFGGRIVGNGDPKYLNSPETALYNKSQILYGLNFAKEAIKTENCCLITEGYFDVIACHNANIFNTVATSGTALTAGHMKLIQRFSKNIILAFDADTAGQEAAKRAFEIALHANMQVFILAIPHGKDPDEALRHNSEEFKAALHQRVPAMEFFLQQSLHNKNINDIAQQRTILQEVFPLISAFPHDLERNYYVQQLADKLHISPHLAAKEFQSFQKKTSPQRASQKENSTPPSQKNFSIDPIQFFIGMLSAFPNFFSVVQGQIFLDLFPESFEKKFYKHLEEKYNAQGFFSPQEVASSFSPEEIKKWEVLTLYCEEKGDILSDEKREEVIRKLIRDINISLVKLEQKRITASLKNAPHGSTEQRELLKKQIDLTRLLSKL